MEVGYLVRLTRSYILTVAVRFCYIFALKKNRTMPVQCTMVRAWYDYCTGTARCTHGRLTVPVRHVQWYGHRTGIVRAPCGHHELPVRYPQSVFSDINKRPVCVSSQVTNKTIYRRRCR